MRMGRLWRRTVFLFVALGFSVPCRAETPMQEIKQATDKIISIVTNPSLKSPEKAGEKKNLIRKTVDEIFDWNEMARRTLARHWAGRTDQEKEEFTRLFSDLLERTYLERVEGYSGQKVLYTGERVDGDYAVVDVKIESQQGSEIPVNYRLKKKGSEWYVYDVSIEGVSLINNYRTQFNSILVNSSFKDLIRRLKSKLSEG
jgi:phospholipid transport system substrate-binding protein